MREELNNRVNSFGGSKPHERRRDTRQPFTATVEALEFQSKTRIQGRTSDLSRGGCYVDAISSFPAGSIVKMRLTKEKDSFEAQAEVVYSLVGMGMGVKFTAADPQQLRIVQHWLGEPCGEPVDGPKVAQPAQPSSDQGSARDTEIEILSELVMELTKQGVLSNAKCESLLQRLSRTAKVKGSVSRVA